MSIGVGESLRFLQWLQYMCRRLQGPWTQNNISRSRFESISPHWSTVKRSQKRSWLWTVSFFSLSLWYPSFNSIQSDIGLDYRNGARFLDRCQGLVQWWSRQSSDFRRSSPWRSTSNSPLRSGSLRTETPHGQTLATSSRSTQNHQRSRCLYFCSLIFHFNHKHLFSHAYMYLSGGMKYGIHLLRHGARLVTLYRWLH
jgi:hypothetical protein